MRIAVSLRTVAAVAVFGLAGCSLWGMEGGPGGAGIAPPVTSSPAAVTAVVGADGVQRVEVTVDDDLRFSPSVVRAKPGTIEFTFRNVGVTPHDVRVLGDLTSGNINGGEVATVRVTVERPGTYPFPCLYHASSGMRGTLEVS